jgi:hypothetical protein
VYQGVDHGLVCTVPTSSLCLEVGASAKLIEALYQGIAMGRARWRARALAAAAANFAVCLYVLISV